MSIELGLVGIAVLCALFLLYRILNSPLRALPIPFEAWRVAIASVRTKPVPVVLAALVIALGAGLQEFFTYGPRFDNEVLTFVSIGWQAVVAIMMAMIAVPFHLHIIGREPKGYIVATSSIARGRFAAVLLHAAMMGGTIWLIGYLIDIAGRWATLSVPEDRAVLVYRGMQLAGFVVATSLALIRPANSSGLRQAIVAGVSIAIRHLPSLLVVEGLLLIPPIAFGVIAITLVRTYLGLSIGIHVLNDVSIVLFSTFQFLAFEAASVIFFRTAILVPDPATDNQRAYAFARPY